MQTAFAAATILFVGSMGLMLMDDKSPTVPSPQPPRPRQVSARLLGPVTEVKGVVVPDDVLAKRTRFFQIQEPSVVSVTLPDGKQKTLPAKTAFINTQSGVVVDVDLLPLMRSVPYKEAIGELHRCLDHMGISPNDQMRKMMAEWPDDALGFDPVKRPDFFPHTYRAGMALSESASLMVKVRSADDGGWFFVLTFEADGPARRAVRVSGREAAKKPAEDEAQDKE